MGNLDYDNHQDIILDGIDDAPCTLPNPEEALLARELFTARGSRFLTKSRNSLYNPAPDLLDTDGLDFLRGRWLETETIFCHDASTM